MKYHATDIKNLEQSLAKGIAKAIELTLQSDSKELLIYTGNKGIFNGRKFADVIGDDLQRQLLKNREIRFRDISIFLEFSRSKKSGFRRGIILAPWSSSHDLSDIQNSYNFTHLVFTPWNEKELSEYESRNSDSIKI